jgi:hypothetical protein
MKRKRILVWKMKRLCHRWCRSLLTDTSTALSVQLRTGVLKLKVYKGNPSEKRGFLFIWWFQSVLFPVVSTLSRRRFDCAQRPSRRCVPGAERSRSARIAQPSLSPGVERSRNARRKWLSFLHSDNSGSKSGCPFINASFFFLLHPCTCFSL